jgi:hypothetical protein
VVKWKPATSAGIGSGGSRQSRNPDDVRPEVHVDGQVLGSIGEVVAQETFGFELLPMSARAHDAHCKTRGAVQVKIAGGKSIAMRQNCHHLVVLKVLNPEEAEVVYDGPGGPA